MKVINQRYEFLPPKGDPTLAIVILGLQEYSPGRTRKVEVWTIHDPPETYALMLGRRFEFDNWKVLVEALAHVFCDDDLAVAAERLKSVPL